MGIFMKKRSTIMWCLLAEMQTVFQDMPIAGGTGETKYRGDVAESDKSYGFCHRGTDNQLFVFEAAIDLLSFIQLFPKDWKKRSYLSLGGISSAALMAFLSERPQITRFSCAWIMTMQGMKPVRNWQ